MMTKIRGWRGMLLVAVSVCCALSFSFAEGAKKVAVKPDLPKVLVIGDSISLGYFSRVRVLLKGKAVVRHNAGNAGPTMLGIANIERWLGNTKWDVIHFNWGLWDMYGWSYVNVERTPELYEKRLEQLVSRLEKTGAKLIWGTTTPVCTEAEWTMQRKYKKDVLITPELEKKYHDAAMRVMKKHHIQVDDLYGCIKPDYAKYTLGPKNVHYNKGGYNLLGKQVAKTIEATLKEMKDSASSN